MPEGRVRRQGHQADMTAAHERQNDDDHRGGNPVVVLEVPVGPGDTPTGRV